jgi:hypothetical protein
VVLREWVCQSLNIWYTQWASKKPPGFYECHPTGETRTIEVPEAEVKND